MVEKQQRETILVNGYAYPSIGPETLQAWLPDLTFVSTFSYGFTADGQLIDLMDENIIRAAQPAGVQSLMVLTPLDSQGAFNNQLAKALLENPQAQDQLIDNILDNIRTKGMFGVDFDFEYVLAENRDQYTELVRKARQRLNAAGYLVTVALAPKTSADQPGLLYQGHDYRGMGQAANFILTMTYEWGYTYGPPMAVAPLNQVRRVLDYAVSEVPPDQLLMGIPNYGYDWTLPFVQGESRAEKISNDEAIARAERYGVEIFFDEQAQSPYYYYTDENGADHVVWFEDERSMQAKLALVSEYGLAGVSYWNIMDYFAAGSEVLREMYDVAKV
ncbi:glycosyl hydrolase family 18 protein [Clostridiales Family XIII bacterium ASD5510]|uniref:Glycosyl hydrolase family 18 protein n=2 Tax=Anaerovoracaceae TaxID=543314 RepID=A0A9J6QKA1_9FIRM|nr:glycosyl hydrolase family 18 protein [Hominibacterium faecale]MCU7377561.1 glycosyl hydrolase family 18 protein [Hominibacterium faecale]